MSEELRISYPPELPVSAMRDEIAEAIRDNQVVIVAGATGSGKTTQIPKIALELGRTSIAHTQPRRIAARTIAERIAEEMGVELGTLVGYQVRFTDKASASTRIKLMTDGILLNELTRDRMLRRYDTIILDEAHERSLTIDFLLGYLKQLLPKRPDLKVIVTSATIDPESFAKHFASADGTPVPIIEVSGRTYPVEIRYRPLVADTLPGEDDEGAAAEDLDLLGGIQAGLRELDGEAPGDVLVFLSGENEIRDASDALSGLPQTEVLPLYGRLSAADQHRVFEQRRSSGVRRRVILATNVAETSLTVPGIKYVIDGGTARISRYGARSKVQRLPIEAVSQASANQRAGRAGRTSDGIAIRLYSEEDYEKRPEFTDPEILRTSLAAVILQMLTLGLGEIADFPFLQPPDARGIKDGLDLLRELGAVRADGSVTRVGRDIARLPLDPRFARMLVESKKHGVTREVLAIVSGLSIQDPRERPLEKRPQADEKHARFADPTSDFLSLLNLWNYLEEKQRELSSSAFRRLCKAEYLNYLRVREWADVSSQLRRLAKPLDLTIGEPKADPDGVHRSILAGLLSQIGVLDERSTAKPVAANAGRGGERRGPDARNVEYVGARQVKFAVFPGSSLGKKRPAAVMAAELVETSRLFARTVAAIDPAWAEQLAGDLVKRSHSEPHWEAKQGSAVGWERVTLFGVPLVARRRIQWSRIDAPLARELFIRHALVEGEWPPNIDRSRDRNFDFERANAKLRRELEAQEERTRRRDILVDDEAVVDFYDDRLPADIVSVRSFETWWAKERIAHPERLLMRRSDLVDEDDEPETEEAAYPPRWTQGDQTLRLRYRFEPGAEDDGVTAQVPLALLPRLTSDGFDWLVPGFRHELVTTMLKTLPKAIRRTVVPAADWATRLEADLPEQPSGSLAATLATAIRRATGAPATAEDFDVERLAPHLRMSFAVIDENGRLLATSTSLETLQQRFAERARDSVAKVFSEAPRGRERRPGPGAPAAPVQSIERAGITTWDFDELPETLEVRRGGGSIRAYPALVDHGSSVSITLLATREEQVRSHRAGVLRLLQLAIPSPVSYLNDHLTSAEKLSLATSPYPSSRALFDDALLAVIDDRLRERTPDGLIWTKADFEAARDAISAASIPDLFALVSLVSRVLLGFRAASIAVKDATSMALLSPLTDLRGQLAALVYPGFISATGVRRLSRLPVYLAGAEHRVAKLQENPNRDRVWMNEVQSATDRYLEAGGSLPLSRDAEPRLAEARWMIEELRLSLFAQHLGALGPVSVQRITKVLAGK
ncbi:ATP-dependent RNA helicase HrpA [Amnibacterium flavum]|uniref:ATP-dependent RNA helicase HrpA n=1 Tax=Amnibacterium flavum TaxID=2173173 RepID=A0A2V1HTR1_9MICO|nr:ATP-dependent RNA helicase HrpA [Amnibacterium flavum]PVZ93484.1 ATP-dependent RNA helicase HrpA [Amnibacterium flavum]